MPFYILKKKEIATKYFHRSNRIKYPWLRLTTTPFYLECRELSETEPVATEPASFVYLENKMAENQTLKIHDHTTNDFARKMLLFLELPNGDYWTDWTKVQKITTTCKKGNKYYCFVTNYWHSDRKFAFILRYSVLKKKKYFLGFFVFVIPDDQFSRICSSWLFYIILGINVSIFWTSK